MLAEIVNKQRRAVSVVKAALLSVGISGRSVSVGFDSWTYSFGQVEKFAVFVSGPAGADVEPYYETGGTIVEAVKNMIDSIKGKTNAAKSDDQSEKAPF